MKKHVPFITVIIPVWNPGPGITRCIDSLRKQTLEEIEMIFVDDCGTDDSMDKVRAAAAEDSRIRILENEENIGAGPSRNKGMDAAKGDYLSFVDPDDYVAYDFLELLLEEANKQYYDIVKGYEVRVNKKGIDTGTNRGLNQKIENGLSQGKPLYTLFTYEHKTAIFRKKFLLSNNIRFGTSSRAQDTTFLLQACAQTESISIVDEANYYFCEREESAMHTLSAEKLQGFLHGACDRLDYILNNLPQDNNTTQRIRGLFLEALREYVRYAPLPEMKSCAEDFLSELRSTLMRLPYYDELIKTSPSLQILCDYGIGLPLIPYWSPWEEANPPVRYAELVQRWVDFYLNSSKDKVHYQKELKNLIVRANNAAEGKPRSTYSVEERKQGRTLLNHQIKRLPLSLRLQIVLSLVKSRAKITLASKIRD